MLTLLTAAALAAPLDAELMATDSRVNALPYPECGAALDWLRDHRHAVPGFHVTNCWQDRPSWVDGGEVILYAEGIAPDNRRRLYVFHFRGPVILHVYRVAVLGG